MIHYQLKVSALIALFIGILASSCTIVDADPNQLNAKLSKTEVAHEWQETNNCNTCHKALPKTGEHRLHLDDRDNTFDKYNPNGIITCVDCHALSIHTVRGINTEYSSTDSILYPDLSHLIGSTDFSEVQEYLTDLFDYDSVPHYRTTLYHKNGAINVELAETNLEKEDGERIPATYNFKTKTCSTNACHKKERW
ncbi:MAG: hypothetical protein OCC49_14550 [Fibrobacterales bacterium]